MKKLFLFILILSSFNILRAQWTAVNNGLGSLQIKGLAVDSNNVFAITANQGIFRSTNSGNSWTVHPLNSALPNFNINSSFYDWFSPLGGGTIIYGQGFISFVTPNSLFPIPVIGIPNNQLTWWIVGFGSQNESVMGTLGGLFKAPNISSASWTEIPGLNNANARTINGLTVYDQGDDEYLIVGTADGMYRTQANSTSGLIPFNTGLGSNVIRALLGPIALTKNGIYLLPDDNGITTGWQTLYPSGDFRTLIFTIDDKAYFFGNNVGLLFSDDPNTPPTHVDLTGISGGAITSCAIEYFGLSGGYIYVGTETGGVFRKQFVLSSVEDGQIVNDFKLNQNYPNPFNPSTKISFSIPTSEFVTLKVYDVLGREVATLVNENLNAGSYSYNFDASNLTSGVYLYKLQAGKYSETKKMILSK